MKAKPSHHDQDEFWQGQSYWHAATWDVGHRVLSTALGKERVQGCHHSHKKKDCIVLQDPPVFNINSYSTVSGDLHHCKTGPELMVTAVGITIKNN